MKKRNENSSSASLPLSLDDAFQKALSYCAKAERSECAVRNKLFSWQVDKAYYQEIIDRLYQLNYLNKERYALAFVHDKYKLSLWGRDKIKRELALIGIPSKIIDTAISEVLENSNEEEQLHTLLKKKLKTLKHTDSRSKHFDQLMRFAVYKGYPYNQVKRGIKQLLTHEDEP